MSLLDRNAPHVVYVLNRTEARDASGRRVYVPGAFTPHRCAVQPARDWSSAEESVTAGLQLIDLRVVLSREWSGDENSHVYWDGDVYEMIGAAQPQKMSRRTRHWRVTMRRIGTVPEGTVYPPLPWK